MMKKNIAIITAWFLMVSCAGNAQQMGRAGSGDSGNESRNNEPASSGAAAADELDRAIRETSDYLNKNVPEGSRIAILNVQSASPALSDYIIDELIANAVNDKVFAVIDRQQLNLIRGELDFQYSGDVDDNSAQSIGKLIGAEIIVSGAVGKYGDMYRMRIRALAVQTAQVQGQFNRNIPEGRTIAALMSSAAVGYSTGSSPAVTPAQAPAAPASATPSAYKIGDTGPAGGIIFYDTGSNSGGWQYLEAAPASTEGKFKWLTNQIQVGGTKTALGTGKQNTQILAADFSKGVPEATLLCVELDQGGFQDWFLPSKDELNLMYINLKRKNLGGFGNDFYWSSSETEWSHWAWAQKFSDGTQSDRNAKDQPSLVRAVRAF
jgi:hypothetical protein